MSLLIAAWMASHADLWFADQVYHWQGGRWALKKAFLNEDIIHIAGRNLSALVWLSVLVSYAISIHRDNWSHLRRPLAYLLLATLTGTLLVAWVKAWSNVDCPWDLLRYGGDRPYIDLFSLRPIGLSRGRCFPAGHASAGYAWRTPKRTFEIEAGIRNVLDRDLLASNARLGADRELTFSTRLIF